MRTYNNGIDNDLLQRLAPSVFAGQAASTTSNNYQFLPTFDVIQALQKNDWMIVAAGEQRVKSEERQGFQKHTLRLRHASFKDMPAIVGDAIPELVLVNSHDGKSAYQLHAGLFRFVCSNGLVVADSTFEKISVRHVNFNKDQVIEASYKIIENVPQIMNQVNEMKSITLDSSEKQLLAESALILKYDNKDDAPLRPEKLLTLRRREDSSNDLWSTFNVIQENIIKGGLRDYQKRKADNSYFSRTREVKSIDESNKLNKALWHLANEFKQMKRSVA